jgi:hypothetical protein
MRLFYEKCALGSQFPARRNPEQRPKWGTSHHEIATNGALEYRHAQPKKASPGGALCISSTCPGRYSD